MTRWSAITRTRRSCSALAHGSRSTAAAEKTSTGTYTTNGDATYAGSDLSRKRSDFHLLDEQGQLVEVDAARLTPTVSQPP
jgi:hypothetical protein